MKIYKVNMDIWVKGNSKKEALDNLLGDMDHLIPKYDTYVNVVLDIEVTASTFRQELNNALFKENGNYL
jgi:hypothetical protein